MEYFSLALTAAKNAQHLENIEQAVAHAADEAEEDIMSSKARALPRHFKLHVALHCLLDSRPLF